MPLLSITLRQYFPHEVKTIKAKRRIVKDVDALRNKVETFLNADPPLSMTEVSKRIGLKQHHIRHHFPDLHTALVQRFAVYKHDCASQRQNAAAEAVRQAVIQLQTNGQMPTKTRVAFLLNKKGRPILSPAERDAFSQIMHELELYE